MHIKSFGAYFIYAIYMFFMSWKFLLRFDMLINSQLYNTCKIVTSKYIEKNVEPSGSIVLFPIVLEMNFTCKRNKYISTRISHTSILF